MKSISQCILEKDWKCLALCTSAGIKNKKMVEGQKRKDYSTDM